jgi:hypothetical protein
MERTRVIKPGTTFTNTDSVSWFAQPRSRFEKLVIKATLSDSLLKTLEKSALDNALLSHENEVLRENIKQASLTSWMQTAGLAVLALIALIGIIR